MQCRLFCYICHSIWQERLSQQRQRSQRRSWSDRQRASRRPPTTADILRRAGASSRFSLMAKLSLPTITRRDGTRRLQSRASSMIVSQSRKLHLASGPLPRLAATSSVETKHFIMLSERFVVGMLDLNGVSSPRHWFVPRYCWLAGEPNIQKECRTLFSRNSRRVIFSDCGHRQTPLPLSELRETRAAFNAFCANLSSASSPKRTFQRGTRTSKRSDRRCTCSDQIPEAFVPHQLLQAISP